MSKHGTADHHVRTTYKPLHRAVGMLRCWRRVGLRRSAAFEQGLPEDQDLHPEGGDVVCSSSVSNIPKAAMVQGKTRFWTSSVRRAPSKIGVPDLP